jgi:hypothetical protein
MVAWRAWPSSISKGSAAARAASRRTCSPTPLFDALGRFIARDESSFAQESVGDDLRRQLQTKIQRDQLKRDWEGKLSRQIGDDEARVLSYMGSAGRPGSVLGRITLAARKLVGR